MNRHKSLSDNNMLQIKKIFIHIENFNKIIDYNDGRGHVAGDSNLPT